MDKEKVMKECQRQVANKHGLGSALVTGHKAAYFNEASYLYSDLQTAKYRQALEEIRALAGWKMPHALAVQIQTIISTALGE